MHPLPEGLIGERRSRGPHDGGARTHEVLLVEVLKRGQKLATGEVAGGAEDDDDARVRARARRHAHALSRKSAIAAESRLGGNRSSKNERA